MIFYDLKCNLSAQQSLARLRIAFGDEARRVFTTGLHNSSAVVSISVATGQGFSSLEEAVEDYEKRGFEVTRKERHTCFQNRFICGRIDHAHHYNNPYRALDETLELETALLAALERVNPTETLIVVTADHGHVMTFGGQATPRGHPVLGADTVPSDIDGLRYTTILYGSGPGHAEPRAVPANASGAAGADAVHAAAAPRQWATHGGEDVPVYALGPMATILFAGVVEQSYIPHAIAYAACLAHQGRRCQVKANSTQAQAKIPSCVAPEVSSVSVGEDAAAGEAAGGRRVVVASSVMSDERTRAAASAPRAAPLIARHHFKFTPYARNARVTTLGLSVNKDGDDYLLSGFEGPDVAIRSRTTPSTRCNRHAVTCNPKVLAHLQLPACKKKFKRFK
ncbi:Alkaline phosphatase, tissue-nonspecific isozyme [Eumeta japonica]|uniref:alkaline phosphatase n=1 Tax=Eumeta variegata TaxID=151549 RepID=A0A4C1X4D5_EUMVA|nr:Alkaline phosphatase, tissue-nonspecific isozyme [Eumeta japonica]